MFHNIMDVDDPKNIIISLKEDRERKFTNMAEWDVKVGKYKGRKWKDHVLDEVPNGVSCTIGEVETSTHHIGVVETA